MLPTLALQWCSRHGRYVWWALISYQKFNSFTETPASNTRFAEQYSNEGSGEDIECGRGILQKAKRPMQNAE